MPSFPATRAVPVLALLGALLLPVAPAAAAPSTSFAPGTSILPGSGDAPRADSAAGPVAPPEGIYSASRPSAAAAPAAQVGPTPLPAKLDVIENPEADGGYELRRRGVQSRVVGGTVADIRNTPWQVWLYSENGNTSSMCGGSIVSPSHIVTAAHCIQGLTIGAPFDKNGLLAFAGISNFNADSPGDVDQPRLVTNARQHPLYVHGDLAATPVGDIAVLTLQSPLDVNGPAAKTIALPASTVPSIDFEPVPVGPAVKMAGFGLQAGGTGSQASGQLYTYDASVVDPDLCGAFPNASGLCVKAPAQAVCSGDSGSGLVAGGVLVGVVSSGDASCAPGGWARFTSLVAPENRVFVEGSSVAPPTAPRQTLPVTVSSGSMLVGQTVTCSGAGFNGAGTTTKWVVWNDLGTRLASTNGLSIAYTYAPGDVGRKIMCRAYGSNAGGVATSELMTSGAAVSAPPARPRLDWNAVRFRISAARSVRRGSSVTVRGTVNGLTLGVQPRITASITTPTQRRLSRASKTRFGTRTVESYKTSTTFTARFRSSRRQALGWYRTRFSVTISDGVEQVTDHISMRFRVRR